MKITEEMIRSKAYALWEESGRPMGLAEQNWAAAEALLLDSANTTPSVRNQLPPNGLRQLSRSR